MCDGGGIDSLYLNIKLFVFCIGGSRVSRPLTTGIVEQQFPLLRAPRDWSNARLISQFEYRIVILRADY